MKQYYVNEIFFSLQGEGMRAGTANVFVRFAHCNLRCSKDDPESGFDCDTEFDTSREMTAADILDACAQYACENVIFTGGEPLLQLDDYLVLMFKTAGWYVAIETNGTFPIPAEVDWVCVSPKTAAHTLRVEKCDEIKYVRHEGQELPEKPPIKAEHWLVSPVFDADGTCGPEDLAWCIELVKSNDPWRLSIQQHKLWGVR